MPAVQALLTRIGLDAPPPPDLGGLRELHRAYVEQTPYETLASTSTRCRRCTSTTSPTAC